jgi:hypothetical protein
MSPRMRVSDRPSAGADPGLSFQGVVVVDAADGVTIGLKGQLVVPILFEAVVPLGAHFPFGAGQADNWWIYLGADGYRDASPADGRGLGPIRATILPDLVPAEADAYLMLRGRGIQRWPRGGSLTITDGFVLAFGFAFEYTLGITGIVWAEIHAGADILIATRPLTLAGFGAVGGSLNLGPFSIGVDAALSFIAVANADPYVHARLCGHIDLFFTSIEGCVEISVNNPPTLAVPPPDVHPLDDVQKGVIAGDLAFLIDDRYRRVGRMARSPGAVRNEDCVWPDTLLHLSFAVSPKLGPGYVVRLGPGATNPQFTPIDSYPTGLAAEPVGSDMLRYEWTLTGLALYDVTDDPGGAGTLVPGPLSAAWQVGKDGDIGTRPQPGDLVLLTYQGDLILDRLADAGAGLPHDPLTDAASACHGEGKPEIGWAVGFDVTPLDGGFLMPADPISPDPCVSRFTAVLTQRTPLVPNLPLGPATAALLPSPYDFTPAWLDLFSPPLRLERDFLGLLVLAAVTGPATGKVRLPPLQSAQVVPQEPLVDGRLWLVVDGPLEQADRPLLAVRDDRADAWANTERRTLPDGRTALRFSPTVGGPVTWVEIDWLVGRMVGVLGIGGVTATAQAAAAARNTARQAEASRQAEAAATQPQQADDDVGAGVHCVLAPGRLYRLDVAMSWDGWIYKQDENGAKQPAGQESGRTDYTPAGGGSTPTNRSYFFRTTPKPTKVTSSAIPPYGAAKHVEFIHRRRDLFDPHMLARHLLGYTPSQTETARFCDDPVNAHFSAAHVTTLAKKYGYTLKLGLQRVDVPGADGEPIVLNPLWVALNEPGLLTGADRRRYEVASKAICPVPKPGGTLTAMHPLSAEAWYEVYALAESDDKSVLDGRLDGVTFKTSRWRNPAGMLAGIGFKTGDLQAPAGDIEILRFPPLGPPVVDGSDADFEAALDAIGVSGWPPTGEPRLSAIWLRTEGAAPPAWRCAGLLAESPEPIDRPGRAELAALRLVMQPLPAGTFDIRRSDRTRSRILFLCSTPFVPATWRRRLLFGPLVTVHPTIAMDLVDRATGTTLTGSLQLPLEPRFAQEA